MRARLIPLTLLLMTCLYAHASKDQSLQELIDRAASAKVDDQPNLYVEIMERQLKNADHFYGEGALKLFFARRQKNYAISNARLILKIKPLYKQQPSTWSVCVQIC